MRNRNMKWESMVSIFLALSILRGGLFWDFFLSGLKNEEILRRIKPEPLVSMSVVEYFLHRLPPESETRQLFESVQKLAEFYPAYALGLLSRLPEDIRDEAAEIVVQDLKNLYSGGRITAQDYLRAIVEFRDTVTKEEVISEMRKLAEKVPVSVARVVVRENITDQGIGEILLAKFKQILRTGNVFPEGSSFTYGAYDGSIMFIFNALMHMGIKDEEMINLIEEKFESVRQKVVSLSIGSLIDQLGGVDGRGYFYPRTYKELRKILGEFSMYMEMVIRLDRGPHLEDVGAFGLRNFRKLANWLIGSLHQRLSQARPRDGWDPISYDLMGLLTRIGIIWDKFYTLSFLKGDVSVLKHAHEIINIEEFVKEVVNELFYYTHSAYSDINRTAAILLRQMIETKIGVISYIAREKGEEEEEWVDSWVNDYFNLFFPRYLNLLTSDDVVLKAIVSQITASLHFQDPRDEQLVISVLQSLIFMPDEELSASAVESLGIVWTPGKQGELIEHNLLFLLENSGSVKIKESAARALYQIWLKKFNPEESLIIYPHWWIGSDDGGD
jgi:hypothetical protein